MLCVGTKNLCKLCRPVDRGGRGGRPTPPSRLPGPPGPPGPLSLLTHIADDPTDHCLRARPYGTTAAHTAINCGWSDLAHARKTHLACHGTEAAAAKECRGLFAVHRAKKLASKVS